MPPQGSAQQPIDISMDGEDVGNGAGRGGPSVGGNGGMTEADENMRINEVSINLLYVELDLLQASKPIRRRAHRT